MSVAPGNPHRGSAPRILAVAQAFKGSLSAGQVADALDRASGTVTSNKRTMVGSDGGDGLLEAVRGRLTRTVEVVAAGPFGTPVAGAVGWLDDSTAIVESRLFCGLSLVELSRRDPGRASTRGVGEVLLRLGNLGATTVLIGLGGSASVDGGTGLARALGWRFLDAAGAALPEGGGALPACRQIVAGSRPPVRVIGLADVRNPLTGAGGAVVYAPQKGASPAQARDLERGLECLVAVLQETDGATRQRAVATSAGAAGGLGFGLLQFAGGALVSGSEWVLDQLGFDAELVTADLVVTGEGAFDATSWEGKLTGEVIRRARNAGVPVALVAPSASGVPDDVTVESGGGAWADSDLMRAAERAVRRALGLPLA